MANKSDRDMLVLALRMGMSPAEPAMKALVEMMDPSDVLAVIRSVTRSVRAMPRAKPKPTAVNQSAINRLKQLGHR